MIKPKLQCMKMMFKPLNNLEFQLNQLQKKDKVNSWELNPELGASVEGLRDFLKAYFKD